MTKKRYNEIIKRIKELESLLWTIDMIDHWTKEDNDLWDKYNAEGRELKAQILGIIYEQLED